MPVGPARPLVAEERHEAARLVEATRGVLDALPVGGRLVEEGEAPVVVVGQRRHVERAHVAGVAVPVLGGSGPVGEAQWPCRSAKSTRGPDPETAMGLLSATRPCGPRTRRR